MFITLTQVEPPLMRVYSLAEGQKNATEDIAAVQAASLDMESHFGLQGFYGLYCSDEWWNNPRSGVMPSKYVSGTITRIYSAGLDSMPDERDFELILEDGSKWTESCYANEQDCRHFHVGHRVDIFYALDPLKKQPAKDGTTNYSKIVVEMAVSLEPYTRQHAG